NITIARNDTVPVIFRIKYRDADGTLHDTDLTGDVWELLIEWENDALRLSSANGFLAVQTPNVIWPPQAAQVDRIPVNCATYRLIREISPHPGGERRTCLTGTLQVF